MSWKTVTSQDSIDQLLRSFEWSDAFVREAHLVSPSYIVPEDRATGHPDALPSMRFLITSPSPIHPALELFFVGIEELSVWFGASELSPSATWGERQVVWSFHKSIQQPIRAGSLRYRFLDESVWGDELRYGWEPIFDDAGQVI